MSFESDDAIGPPFGVVVSKGLCPSYLPVPALNITQVSEKEAPESISRQYHHGRCDVGSPWGKGSAYTTKNYYKTYT